MRIAFYLVLLLPSSVSFAVIGGRQSTPALTEGDRLMRQLTVRWISDRPGQTPFICSGVQVSSSTFLSAGHCASREVRDSIARGLSYVEAYDPDAPLKSRRLPVVSVRGIDTARVDFAVVEVRGTLPARQSLPIADPECDEDSAYILAGFGLDDRMHSPTSLRSAVYVPAEPAMVARRNALFGNHSLRRVLSPG